MVHINCPLFASSIYISRIGLSVKINSSPRGGFKLRTSYPQGIFYWCVHSSNISNSKTLAGIRFFSIWNFSKSFKTDRRTNGFVSCHSRQLDVVIGTRKINKFFNRVEEENMVISENV